MMKFHLFFFSCLISFIGISQDEHIDSGLDSIANSVKIGKVKVEIIEMCDTYIEPNFPGGYEALEKYVSHRVVNLCGATITRLQFYLELVISENGSIEKVSIYKLNCPEMNSAIVQIFERMPKWSPALDKNGAMKSRVAIPMKIIFK